MVEIAISPATHVTYLSASSALNSGGIGGVQAEIESESAKRAIEFFTIFT